MPKFIIKQNHSFTTLEELSQEKKRRLSLYQTTTKKGVFWYKDSIGRNIQQVKYLKQKGRKTEDIPVSKHSHLVWAQSRALTEQHSLQHGRSNL